MKIIVLLSLLVIVHAIPAFAVDCETVTADSLADESIRHSTIPTDAELNCLRDVDKNHVFIDIAVNNAMKELPRGVFLFDQILWVTAKAPDLGYELFKQIAWPHLTGWMDGWRSGAGDIKDLLPKIADSTVRQDFINRLTIEAFREGDPQMAKTMVQLNPNIDYDALLAIAEQTCDSAMAYHVQLFSEIAPSGRVMVSAAALPPKAGVVGCTGNPDPSKYKLWISVIRDMQDQSGN